MVIEFGKIAENIKFLVIHYVEILVGIIVNPSSTFALLLGSQGKEKYTIVEPRKFDEKPLVFAGISLVIGLLLGASLSIKDTPNDLTSLLIAMTVIPVVFIWLLYGIFIHFCAHLLGGKGKLFQTIAGVFYVLGALHPLLLFFIYLLSLSFPDALSYKMTLRELSMHRGLIYELFHSNIKILGTELRVLYYSVSTILTMIYLYFPLSLIHNLSLFRIIAVYIIGIGAILVFSVISIFGLFILVAN
ncbi:MAG TPA: hypothetical protein VN843_25250 [Anaerolineales bacterium]|nr:hypothetical protein [Anaerolineales bacterium]